MTFSELHLKERPWNNGPWEWDSGVGRVEIYGAVTVPQCPVPLRSHPICVVDTQESDANAQLIALAPEMAEAILTVDAYGWDVDTEISEMAERIRKIGDKDA